MGHFHWQKFPLGGENLRLRFEWHISPRLPVFPAGDGWGEFSEGDDNSFFIETDFLVLLFCAECSPELGIAFQHFQLVIKASPCARDYWIIVEGQREVDVSRPSRISRVIFTPETRNERGILPSVSDK